MTDRSGRRCQITDEHLAYLRERCSYLKYGQCSTLGCLRRGGYDGSISSVNPTCIEKELYDFIEAHRQAITGQEPDRHD